MKKAVIVVGSHHAGKSVTINQHLKPLLGMGEGEHQFNLNGRWGFIWSQSAEESGRDLVARIRIKIEISYELFVLAARPASEPGSELGWICDALSKASFAVQIIEIQNPDQAPSKAKDAFKFLNSN